VPAALDLLQQTIPQIVTALRMNTLPLFVIERYLRETLEFPANETVAPRAITVLNNEWRNMNCTVIRSVRLIEQHKRGES
jgi:hypothetical protein